MAKTLTIRMTDDQESTLQRVQEALGQATASKTLMSILETYMYDQAVKQGLEATVARLEGKLEYRDQIIKELDGACRRALEVTGQGDFF